MLLIPDTIIKKGFVKTRKDYEPFDDNQFQQVGIDVRVANVSRIFGTAKLTRFSKELAPQEMLAVNNDNCWVLQKGAYAIDCMEECVIKQGYEGKLIHRSTFNRSGALLTGSVYDPGYEGLIAGTLYVFCNILVLEYGTRIGQFQIQTAEMGTLYDGDYQNQQSHAEAAERLK